jgi:DNA-binding transcriptional ArsR family regulator
MRPLFHPALDDITVEGVLYALSDPVRVSIYAGIAAQACTRKCSSFLTVSDQAIPKSTLSQHFRVLRENGLVRAERQGVEMHFTTRCPEIEKRFPGLIPAILNAHRIESGEKARGKTTRSRTTKTAARR